MYSGRVGEITTAILRLRNDLTEGFIDETDCLAWINECQKKIADAGYWRYAVNVDLDEGVDTLALADLVTVNLEDGMAVKVISARWVYDGSDFPLTPLSTKKRYRDLLANYNTGAQVFCYYIETGLIYWLPVPDADMLAAVELDCFWRPVALTGAETENGDTPTTDETHDDVFVQYGLAQSALKDRTSETRSQDYQLHMGLYEEELRKLLNNNRSPGFRIKPYR